MKSLARHVVPQSLALIAGLGVVLMLWPGAAASVAFGTDVSPGPELAATAGAWIPMALVRLVGVLLSISASLVLASATGSETARRAFVAVAGLALLITVLQWRAILPFDVGLLATVVVGTVAASGFATLRLRARAGTA